MPRYTASETRLPGFAVRFPDAASFLSAYRSIFEQESYRFHARTNSPLIIDGGANIGLAILYWKRLYPKAQIIAFEADPDIYQYLTKNVQEWGFDDVTLHNFALWTEHGEVAFDREGADAGRINANHPGSIQVPAVPLHDYLDRPVEFLKLDVEGAETEILESCRSALQRVRNLFVEYHSLAGEPQTLWKLLSVLDEAGFRVFARTEFAPEQPFVAPPMSKGIEFALNVSARRAPGRNSPVAAQQTVLNPERSS